MPPIAKLLCVVAAFIAAAVPAKTQFIAQSLKAFNEDSVEVSFPLIESTRQPALARKIQAYLIKAELGLAPGSTRPQMKEALANCAYAEYNFEVRVNHDKLFAIRFFRLRGGMIYMEDDADYAFDASTGDPLALENMFTPSGMNLLKKSLLNEWKTRIKTHLKDERGEEYKTCLDEANEMEGLEIQHTAVTGNGFEFSGRSCLDVTSWQMEGDTRAPFTRSFEQVWYALSPYGLSFFGGQPQSGSLFHAILHGTVDNKYPVTILLFPPATGSQEIHGWEIYDKYVQTIALRGTADNNHISVQELTADGKPVATLDGTWDGKQWAGTFKNATTGKVLPLLIKK